MLFSVTKNSLVTTFERFGVAVNSDELAEKIARARLAKGWSQKTLADYLGVSRGYIGQIERGKPPSKEVLTNLVFILGIPLEELIDFKKLEEQQEGLVDFFRAISPSIDQVSQSVAPEQMMKLIEMQAQNEEIIDRVIDSALSMPRASGPSDWEKLNKADRKLVQEIINRLLKTSRYEGEN